MKAFDPYFLIIALSVIIIISFLFGSLSKKTNVPSVLMLIALGVGLKYALDYFKIGTINFFPILEVLGIVGLIMIVLEAALDLELKKEKLPVIGKAFLVGLFGLVGSVFAAAGILMFFMPEFSFIKAVLYATPLSILSSAIMIPSVGNLVEDKKEFLIYESAISDILGIMFFYFITGMLDPTKNSGTAVSEFFISFGLTIAIALISSYVLILIFQKIKSHVKLFLLIAILLLLYAIGKKMHLSSLIIILIFGLVVCNKDLFFKGFLKKWLDNDKAHHIYEGLHVITLESAFVVRTFFFVIFGITISLASLLDLNVLFISLAILFSIYVIRYIFLKIVVGKNLIPQLYMAPRGLITVLLFYAIPQEHQVETFNNGILLFIIITTGLIMTGALIYDSRRANKKVEGEDTDDFVFNEAEMPSISDKKK